MYGSICPPKEFRLTPLQTIFYPNSKAKASEAMAAPLTRGTALLHRFVLYHRYASPQGLTFYLDTVTSVFFTRVPRFEAALNTSFARISCS